MSTEALEHALYDGLRGDATIAAEVGDRIFVGRVPQLGSMPALLVRKISSNPEYDLQNEITEGRAIYEVRSVVRGDAGVPAAKAVADAVRSKLSGFVGMLGASPDDVEIQGSTLESDQYLFQRPQDSTDEGTHIYALDFFITYEQAVPAH